MKSREIVEYFVYSRFFNSFSILYKGTYCISYNLYHLSAAKSITHAFPFIVNYPESPQSLEEHYEPPSLHTQGNFSFETERFYIMYEEEAKKIRSACIFRLEYQQGKEYTTFLSCKLLKKIVNTKQSQTGLCTRKLAQTSYEVIDTQIFQIKHKNQLNIYERINFRNAEFFSSIDLYLCNFKYGKKLYKGKEQLSNMFTGRNLVKENPAMLLRQKFTVGNKRKEQNKDKKSIQTQFKDMASQIQMEYYELLDIIKQYSRWYKQIKHFRDEIRIVYEKTAIQIMPNELYDLSHLNRGHFLKAADLCRIYGTQSIQQTYICVLEEKELLRRNIRAAREYFCSIFMTQTDKRFKQRVVKGVAQVESVKQEKFVRFQPALSENIGEELMKTAWKEYDKYVNLTPQKLKRFPFLLVEGYNEKMDKLKQGVSLTVFVHGYQGNSFDFQKARNYLRCKNKRTNILVLESITTQMDKSIDELGKTVADQVIKHLQNPRHRYQVINFIGFSLGGVLVRACLQYLEEYKAKLGIFVTFSSPHLGISESDNSLVNLGVWYLIKFDKVKNMKELNFQSVKLQDSFLMKLSKCDLISNFKKVILVCSKDDGFVPLYSTILEDSLCQKEVAGLCFNIRERIRHLQRVQVLFNTQHGGALDRLTGRRGHIQFLENDYFLELFFQLYAPYF